MFDCIYKVFFVVLVFLFFNITGLQAVATLPTRPALSASLPAKPGIRTISEEMLIEKEFCRSAFSSIDWIDSHTIMFGYKGKIETLDINNQSRACLGEGSHPRISPNGEWVAFVEKTNCGNQLALMKNDGSERRQLTFLKEGIGDDYHFNYDFAWSKDSRQLAFYTGPEPMINPDNLTLPRTEIYTLEVMSGILKKVHSDDAVINHLSWYPSNDKLLITRLCIGFINHKDEDISYVQSLQLSDGEVSVLAKFNGRQQTLRPELSPDGLKVSMLYCAESDLFDWMQSAGVVGSQTQNEAIPSPTRLTFDVKLYRSKWSRDGQHLLVTRNYGAYNQLYTVGVKSGQLKQLTHAPLNIADYQIAPDGSRLLWTGMDAHGTSVLRIANINGSNVQDLLTEAGCQEDIALGEVREIEWEPINYPSKMRGLLFLPLDYKEGTKYPLLIDIHGGDSGAVLELTGGILTSTPLEWQLWTAKGYAVFVPEFRSSASFGILAILRDQLQEHDIINCDGIDVMCGLDELVKQGIADNDRVAVIGHSAGGRRVNWLAVSTHRFKAIVSKEGWLDERAQATRFPVVGKLFGGSPTEVPENYLKNSASFHVKGASTPTLFLMGNPDLGGLDFEHTMPSFCQAIKDQGVDVDYVEYNDEGHTFDLPKNRQHAMERAMQWVDRYTRSELQNQSE